MTSTGEGLGLGLGTSLFPVGAMEIKTGISAHNGIRLTSTRVAVPMVVVLSPCDHALPYRVMYYHALQRQGQYEYTIVSQLVVKPLPTKDSYIYIHVHAMDICPLLP